jgi:hypothetical protein
VKMIAKSMKPDGFSRRSTVFEDPMVFSCLKSKNAKAYFSCLTSDDVRHSDDVRQEGVFQTPSASSLKDEAFSCFGSYDPQRSPPPGRRGFINPDEKKVGEADLRLLMTCRMKESGAQDRG